MAIYELKADQITEVKSTTFWSEGIKERSDLQRLLRDHIEIVAPGTMVITEEFGEWEDSKRRIDLLVLDKTSDLVIVELKRTDDGGHMELQAIRYAAMVSAMTFEHVIAAHSVYLKKRGIEKDARKSILTFLGWSEPGESTFAQSVRIVLVAADFSKELTTTVLWLNAHDLDIRCVRAKPYSLDGTRVLLDVQQTIPLPEAVDYQVQLKNKAIEERVAQAGGKDYTRFDVSIGGQLFPARRKRAAIFLIVRRLVERGMIPEKLTEVLPDGHRPWFWVEGNVSAAEFKIRALAKAQQDKRSFDEARWYASEGELMRVDGRTYAFSNQWGGSDFASLLDAVLKLHPDHDVAFSVSVSQSG